ncbi:MAG: hypothetical protein ACI95S_000361 [Dinoroseobacter sp.]|jgi:hypothetical protein
MRILAAGLICIAGAAQADIEVRFIEGAPKDAFSFEAVSVCAAGPVEIALDLASSEAGLVFDVTGSGAGVEVFQPFEVVAGAGLLVDTPMVADGDQALELSLSALPIAMPVRFTIDVDDTLGGREITVSGSEIAGASVSVTHAGGVATAVFGSDARALVRLEGCTS